MMRDPGKITFYENILEENLNEKVHVKDFSPVGGGCIHHAMKVNTSLGKFFVKSNRVADADMFKKEYQGLQELRKAGAINIPVPIGYGTLDQKAYLITEFIESGLQRKDFWKKFAAGLAELHRHHHDRFGFEQDNYIGRLPQRNSHYTHWVDFFIEMRLEPQLNTALNLHRIDTGFLKRFREFMKLLPDLLPEEPPSLLHGDLWSGNFMTGSDGYVVLIDPAVYYGHREIELSFTRMFGGFDQSFYEYYQDEYPLLPGFEDRVDIYNLYPYLVHVNLFGNSYLGGVERVVNLYI